MNVKISTDDLELFVNLIKTSIGLNPRSMKRLFNSYQLLDIITRSSVTGLEENARRKILFAIICMQMGHERLYQYLAFNTVTAERLEQLVDPESSDECILKILDDENAAENDSRYMNRLNDFISYFYQSLQNDDDYDKISEGELADLQSVLKCSSVISLGEEESIDSSSESEDRYKNRMIAKKVNEQLSDLGNLKLWIPKKARGGVKRSDISAHLYFTAKNNFDFTLEYYLSRVPDGRITVYLMIYNKTSRQASVFFETLGENPLDLELLPEFEKGRIMYCEVITVTDDEAVEKISELYRKAYAAIQKFL